MRASIVAVALLAVWASAVFGVFYFAPVTGKRINCSLSEISPDFTPAMREQCRLVRAGRLL